MGGRAKRVVAKPVRFLRAVAKFIQLPPWVPPGHYYSPLTSPADIERALAEGPPPATVAMGEAAQLRVISRIGPTLAQLPRRRWNDDASNNQYGLADAAIYSAIVREFQPHRIIEVGSGYSSAVALDACDAYGLDIELVFIEPHTERLEQLLTPSDSGRVTIRREPLQDTPLELFDTLEAGDVLFIDSTHVVKAGSDVARLVFHVLPRLAAGVLVHVHDMFWPWQYPPAWLSQRRDWNELYLIHAFLSGNPRWEVLLFSDWMWQVHPELVQEHLPSAADSRPGSLWLRKRDSRGSHEERAVTERGSA